MLKKGIVLMLFTLVSTVGASGGFDNDNDDNV